MFKKSLIKLLSCGLLTLAVIVTYAVVGLRGPEDTIREAQVKLAAGQYAEVISLLDQAELGHSIQNNRSLKVELWQLRKQAHFLLGNAAGALQDVRLMLDNGFEDDVDLLLDQIRFLASDKQGDLALLEAKKFLDAHPDHSRGLELAGVLARGSPRCEEISARHERCDFCGAFAVLRLPRLQPTASK